MLRVTRMTRIGPSGLAGGPMQHSQKEI